MQIDSIGKWIWSVVVVVGAIGGFIAVFEMKTTHRWWLRFKALSLRRPELVFEREIELRKILAEAAEVRQEKAADAAVHVQPEALLQRKRGELWDGVDDAGPVG